MSVKIGRKIFYEIATGNKIVDTGERQGAVIATTAEQDIASYTALSERNRNTFDILELPFGAYAWEFANASGYRVNPATKQVEFAYNTPADPGTDPVFEKPLTDKVAELEIENAELKARDAKMNDDLLFVMEVMEGNGMF